MNRYLNPYFGYRFEVQADAKNTTFSVVFTNGVKSMSLTPNATLTSLPDGQCYVIDSKGRSTLFYAWDYYYYDPSTPEDYIYAYDSSYYNGNLSSNGSEWIDPNLVITTKKVNGCDVTVQSYLDSSAAPSYSEVCSNGSYLYFPPAWYNYTYTYWDNNCDNTTNSTANSTSNKSVAVNSTSYWDNYYYSQGCYKDELYFYNETTLYYHYFVNNSYVITYVDGSIETYSAIIIDDYTYWFVAEWSDANCTYSYESTYQASWAKCVNGSTLYFPPYSWF